MEKLYDLTELEALAMGDQDFMKELLAANVESIESGTALIMQHYQSGDYESMSKEAHKIKPLFQMLGSHNLHSSIVDLEHYSNPRKEFDMDKVHAAYAAYMPLAPVLLDQLKNLIA